MSGETLLLPQLAPMLNPEAKMKNLEKQISHRVNGFKTYLSQCNICHFIAWLLSSLDVYYPWCTCSSLEYQYCLCKFALILSLLQDIWCVGIWLKKKLRRSFVLGTQSIHRYRIEFPPKSTPVLKEICTVLLLKKVELLNPRLISFLIFSQPFKA